MICSARTTYYYCVCVSRNIHVLLIKRGRLLSVQTLALLLVLQLILLVLQLLLLLLVTSTRYRLPFIQVPLAVDASLLSSHRGT